MPIYKYECECGNIFEAFRLMDKRYDVTCPECERTPQLVMSRVAPANIFQDNIGLTLVNGNGKVIGERKDHHRTPMFYQYHSRETQQRAAYGQEEAHKEMLAEAERRKDVGYTEEEIKVEKERQRGVQRFQKVAQAMSNNARIRE